jgi:hypothetical protein
MRRRRGLLEEPMLSQPDFRAAERQSRFMARGDDAFEQRLD